MELAGHLNTVKENIGREWWEWLVGGEDYEGMLEGKLDELNKDQAVSLTWLAANDVTAEEVAEYNGVWIAIKRIRAARRAEANPPMPKAPLYASPVSNDDDTDDDATNDEHEEQNTGDEHEEQEAIRRPSVLTADMLAPSNSEYQPAFTNDREAANNESVKALTYYWNAVKASERDAFLKDNWDQIKACLIRLELVVDDDSNIVKLSSRKTKS